MLAQAIEAGYIKQSGSWFTIQVLRVVFILTMMNCVFKMMNCVFKMMNCVLKMIQFALKQLPRDDEDDKKAAFCI